MLMDAQDGNEQLASAMANYAKKARVGKHPRVWIVPADVPMEHAIKMVEAGITQEQILPHANGDMFVPASALPCQ